MLTNEEIFALIKQKDKDITDAINKVEESLLAPEELFDKSKASFHFARLEQLYIEMKFYMAKVNVLGEKK